MEPIYAKIFQIKHVQTMNRVFWIDDKIVCTSEQTPTPKEQESLTSR